MVEYRSNLERVLDTGRFAATVEVGPSKGADPQRIIDKGELVRDCADAYNVTDNQTAVVRLSSQAGGKLLLDAGLEPIMQMTCRDRNRIALQSDILGAYALGMRNLLLLTGDHQSFGNHPGARGVYDMDSLQLIKMTTRMRDEGVFANGEPIRFGIPDMFIGGAVNPFSGPIEWRVERLARKIDAGVDFIQTQSVYDLERFACFMDAVCDAGLEKKVSILAGVTPLKSTRMAKRMKFHVPGVLVPDDVYDRICGADDAAEQGVAIAVETLVELQRMRGVAGVHITALFWEDMVPRLMKEAGLLPRP